MSQHEPPDLLAVYAAVLVIGAILGAAMLIVVSQYLPFVLR